jgi:hypothetical protein
MADARKPPAPKKHKSRGGGATKFTNDVKKDKNKYKKIVSDLTREALNEALPDDAVRKWAEEIEIAALKAHILKIVGESSSTGEVEDVSSPDLERVMQNVWDKVVTYLQREGPAIRTKPVFSTERENSYVDVFVYGCHVSGVVLSPREKEVLEHILKPKRVR